ncbi:MAG: phosphatase PAP2 family protein [Devosia sp.]
MTVKRLGWQSVRVQLSASVASDRPFYVAIGAYVVLALAYMAASGHLHPGDLSSTFSSYVQLWILDNVLVFPLLFLMLAYIRITLRLNTRRNLAYRKLFSPVAVGRFLAGALMMAAFVPFRTMFNSVKNAIPEASGFIWDRTLADIDQALHFGKAPWEWLYATLRHPAVLRAIEVNYETIWFVICFGVQYWVAVSPLFDRIRLRYMLCFVLCWVIIGNVSATLISSAGPIYYGLVTGDFHRFADLMTFTASSAGQFAATTDFQAYLWQLHASELPGLGSGISAFPSMHVAAIVMNALFLIETSRRWVIPAALYVVFVLVSSVYLGWHYAIDGYASILMTAGIFYGLKWAMAQKWRLWPTRREAVAAVVAQD